ncbi:MAG: hypothetical protein QOJ19_201 [Acidimicrobiia bacterium]|nr:hypothetical protein [Acidimicrobiia bacterium]
MFGDGEPILTGLRDPWRFSFDSALSEVGVADVGQDRVEEVNRVRLELDEPAKNLGWSAYEGTTRIPGHPLDDAGELVAPVVTYSHDEGCAVIGGFVYLGVEVPELVRRYLYGDFCSGAIWSLVPMPEGGVEGRRIEQVKIPQLTHIGQDGDGELVFSSATGSLYRAVPAGSTPSE